MLTVGIGVAIATAYIGRICAEPGPDRRIPEIWTTGTATDVHSITILPLLTGITASNSNVTLQRSLVISSSETNAVTLLWNEMHRGRAVSNLTHGSHFQANHFARLIYSMSDGTRIAFSLKLDETRELATFSFLQNCDAVSICDEPGWLGLTTPAMRGNIGASLRVFRTITDMAAINKIPWVPSDEDFWNVGTVMAYQGTNRTFGSWRPYDLDTNSFDAEAMDLIRTKTGLDLPGNVKGLNSRYYPPIDPGFAARLEVPLSSRREILDLLSRVTDDSPAFARHYGSKLDWWIPENAPSVLVRRTSRRHDSFLIVILAEDDQRLLLYIGYGVD